MQIANAAEKLECGFDGMECKSVEEQELHELNEDTRESNESEAEKTSHIDVPTRKNSFVWDYFRPVDNDDNLYECIICNGIVGKQTSNLARHLFASHDIRKSDEIARTRPIRSFVWSYCTKEDKTHARCHLCQKLLYFGCGNTANIAKHLRRRHSIGTGKKIMDSVTDGGQPIEINGNGVGISDFKTELSDSSFLETRLERKERKGASYVWNYCVKLSRHTIRCKLCNKMMSFHGTANIITHLQRRHNIVGKLDNDRFASPENEAQDINSAGDNSVLDILEDKEATAKRRKRSAASSSIVWKYCTRISSDSVVCSFCKKVLSYQGTSNLQRHLHRMHGIVTQVRIPKSASEIDMKCRRINSNFIWEHCTQVDDDKTKCNMCNMVFDCKETEKITKHLAFTHAVEYRREGKGSKFNSFDDDDTSDDDDEFEDWGKSHEHEDSKLNIKKIELSCNEENNEAKTMEEAPVDEDLLQEIPIVNPLSPQSSGGMSPDLEDRNIYSSSNRPNNRRLQKLNEDRLRAETEYFREKAGYYRMQKYLIALQAKKIRLEMDREISDTTTAYSCSNVAKQEHTINNSQLF